MKRFSKKWFSQIMIHKKLKRDLDELKSSIANEISATWKLSYGDEISYLIDYFKKSKHIEYPIEEKLLLGTSFSSTKLKIAVPLEKISSISSATKLDGKQRYFYSVES